MIEINIKKICKKQKLEKFTSSNVIFACLAPTHITFKNYESAII